MSLDLRTFVRGPIPTSELKALVNEAMRAFLPGVALDPLWVRSVDEGRVEEPPSVIGDEETLLLVGLSGRDVGIQVIVRRNEEDPDAPSPVSIVACVRMSESAAFVLAAAVVWGLARKQGSLIEDDGCVWTSRFSLQTPAEFFDEFSRSERLRRARRELIA